MGKNNMKSNNMTKKYLEALREIDTHIRSTSAPIPHIINTLINTLPEYKQEEKNEIF